MPLTAPTVTEMLERIEPISCTLDLIIFNTEPQLSPSKYKGCAEPAHVEVISITACISIEKSDALSTNLLNLVEQIQTQTCYVSSQRFLLLCTNQSQNPYIVNTSRLFQPQWYTVRNESKIKCRKRILTRWMLCSLLLLCKFGRGQHQYILPGRGSDGYMDGA